MPIYDASGTYNQPYGGAGQIPSLVGAGTTPAKKTKTVYTSDGAPREVPADTPVTVWQPNTGYAGEVFFGAPPPPPEPIRSTASMPSGYDTGMGGGDGSSYSQAATRGLSTARPSTSSYTGQPTSSLAAERARLQLETEFAAQAARNQANIQSGALKESAALQAEAEARRLAQLPQIMSQMPGVVSYGSSMGGPQEEAARAAAFARAKEQAGGTALGALRALENYAAGRGQTGSSMERGMIGDVVGGAAGQINEYSRDQMLADLQRAAQISDMNYQGQLQQRGQNISMLPSLMGLIGQRTAY